MDLRSSYPFWLLKDGIIRSYPSLSHDEAAEITIIGAGITGALMAYHLGKAGIKVLMIDRRHAGMGSTAATTGLLQYEIDTPLHRLIQMVGEKNAVRSYALCVQAISKLFEIKQVIQCHADFEFKPSIQYASSRFHLTSLKKEFDLRRQHQIADVVWLEREEIKTKFGFDASGALLSMEGAQVNAYKLTHCLLKFCVDHFGLRVYDSTEVVKFKTSDREVILRTAEGNRIISRKLIVCAGYESENFLPRRIENRVSTYAIVSEPMNKNHFWYEDCLIWETATPYLYMRSTTDGRVLVGGRDDNFYNPEKRDRRVPKKALQLKNDFQSLFPGIPFKIDFEWAGTFCGTPDGLPFIGAVNKRPNTYFALGFGGNGITFSLIAAEIITDIIRGKKNQDSEIFSFSRI